ncbi:MAG: hypothetical protein R2761_14945 [Acidimicrobiales bacterium]
MQTSDEAAGEYERRLKGQPADPAQFELTGVGCERRPDRLAVTGAVRNTGPRRRIFDAAIRVRQLDGSWAEGRRLLDWLEPGETATISHWFGRPELFAASPDCEVTVLDGPEEALVNGG